MIIVLSVLNMWKYNLRNTKLCFNNTSVGLSNFEKYRYRNHLNFRFLYSTKLSRLFLQDSAYESCLFNCSYFLLQVVKKNLQTRPNKLILKPVNDRKEKELLHTSLINSLQNCESMEEQIKVFHSMIKLPDNDINFRFSICQNLEKALQPYFPSLSVYLIGSSTNGLGFKGCDVDLSLQSSTENANEHSVVENSFLSEEDKHSVNKVYASKNQLLRVKKILQALKFEEPLILIPGRCPILNFSVQNVPCDLSWNNSSAFQGTNLMLLCGKLDERVTPLMQIIIYWAKHSKLIGGPGKFKTYAIFLMVIYFLQTRKPPILPSVETMYEKTDFLENLENWSYDVTKYLRKFGKSENNQTVEELVREFFVFYGNYDFNHIIRPINGSSVDRKLITEKSDLNNSFELNSICIQDPLNLEWNVTTGVTWKHCKNFQKVLILVWEKYQDPNFWIRGSHKWGLSSLFDGEFPFHSLRNIHQFTIHIPLSSIVIDHFMQERIPNLLEQAASNVNYILDYCLHFECYVFNHDINLSSLKFPQSVRTVIENQLMNANNTEHFELCTDSSDDNQHHCLIAQYICATKNTWSGRNTYDSCFGSENNVFLNECKISEKLELERENNQKETFYFLCECYGAFNQNSVSLEIKFKPLNNDRFIPKLAIFLKEYIPKFMDQVPYKYEESSIK